jgi:hypothetical protein
MEAATIPKTNLSAGFFAEAIPKSLMSRKLK